MDFRERTRDIGDMDYDNSFEEFCKEDRNGTVARRNGAKRGFLLRNNSIFSG